MTTRGVVTVTNEHRRDHMRELEIVMLQVRNGQRRSPGTHMELDRTLNQALEGWLRLHDRIVINEIARQIEGANV